MTKVTELLIDNHKRQKELDEERGKLDNQLLQIGKRKKIIARKISKIMKWRNDLINRVKLEELKEYQQLCNSEKKNLI